MNDHSSAHEEVAAFFAGQLTGAMGLKSPLGPVLEYGTHVSGSSGASLGPTGSALHAARTSVRIEETLAMLSLEARAVLEARFRPHGPWAPDGLRCMGDVAAVACLLRPADELRALVVLSRSKKREKGRQAAKEVRRVQSKARRAVHEALEAYTRAAEVRRQERRAARRQRWAEGLAG